MKYWTKQYSYAKLLNHSVGLSSINIYGFGILTITLFLVKTSSILAIQHVSGADSYDCYIRCSIHTLDYDCYVIRRLYNGQCNLQIPLTVVY